MRSEVKVSFPGAAPVHIGLEKVEPMALADARAWLDRQFIDLGCEPPMRPTGKVLSADKLVVVAEAAGAARFQDEAWARDYARAAAATLNKPMVHIDVTSMTISF
jgi:hypothetical protein